ncbi:hypothetical protein BC827DRAFT_1268814 [Russula dissimulans]|nr:hypothetical protein BC827DRAFT_1268814 [Russula dissimulans]
MPCRTTASSREKSRQSSVGDYSCVSTVAPPSPSFRINWRKLGSGARSILCIWAANSAYNDPWASGSRDIRKMRARSDAPWVSSPDGAASPNKTPSREQQAHIKKVGGNETTQAALHERARKLRPTERASLSEAATSALLIKERGAHWHGEASPLYDHAVLLNADGMADWAWDNDDTAGETMEAYRALIDAMFQIENRDSRGGSPNLRHHHRPHPNGTNAGSNSKKRRGGHGREKGKAVLGSWNEADARRAWEATKRRVIYIEEFGELPDDAEKAERASSERRARRRKGWVEETIGGKAQEDASLRADKTRRRQGGWWIRENGVFVRLTEFIVHYGLTRISIFHSVHGEDEGIEVPWTKFWESK